MPRTSELDFLRGVAAFFVVLNHARGLLFVGGWQIVAAGHTSWTDYLALGLLQITSLGHEFVILFFVISGFAMAHSFRRPQTILSFYSRRIIRIWPPYLAAVLLAVAVGLDADHAWRVAFFVGASTAYTPQFWSLPFEVIFYLLVPLLLPRLWPTLILSAAAFILVGPTGYFPVDFITCGLPFFMLGAATYQLLPRVPRVSGRRLAAIIAIAFAAAVGARLPHGQSNAVGSLIAAFAAVLLIANVPERLAALRSLNLGHFSYSLYLFHFAFLIVALHILGAPSHNYLVWALAVPPVVFCCWLLYLVTERPCTSLLTQFRSTRHHVDQRSIPTRKACALGCAAIPAE